MVKLLQSMKVVSRDYFECWCVSCYVFHDVVTHTE